MVLIIDLLLLKFYTIFIIYLLFKANNSIKQSFV